MDGTKGKSGGGKRSQRQQHLKTPGAPVEERNGAFPEGARLARVASSPPQRPFQRNWQLTLGGFLSMYHHGTPQDTAKL